MFSEAGIPTYRTPEGTITAFMHMVEYRRNQKQLRETPVLSDTLTANTAEAHTLLQRALSEGATSLDTHEVSPVLRAYGIHTLPTDCRRQRRSGTYRRADWLPGGVEVTFAGYSA